MFSVYQYRISRSPLIIMLLFYGTLLPTLGFIDFYFMRYSFVADHFQYLSCINVIAGCVGWLWNAEREILFGPLEQVTRLWLFQRNPCWLLISALLLTSCMTLTWQRAALYKDAEALWTDTVRKNPNSWLANNNLGNAFLGRNEMDKRRRISKELLS